MENIFGAEYLAGIEACKHGGKNVQTCRMNFETGMVDCDWDLISYKELV